MFISSRKITSAANRFELIYVQIKHDRCRVDFEHNTHWDKRGEVSVQDKKREGKGKKRKFKCRNEHDLFLAFRITWRRAFSHFVYIPVFACGGLKMTNFPPRVCCTLCGS